MKFLGVWLATVSIGLAAAMPLVRPRELGIVALATGLAALSLTALHLMRALARPARGAALILGLVQASMFVLAAPQGPRQHHYQGIGALLLLMISTMGLLCLAADSFNAWAYRAAARVRRHRWVEGLGVSVLSVLIFLAGAEFLAASLARTKLLPFYRPLTTQYRGQPVTDWRPFHITADHLMVPDPYLFWKPAASAPYNSRGFKGPDFAAVKPPGVFRIITLGDSNTDGPDQGGWPDELHRLLKARAGPGGGFEVINGGVAGYTSLQGLRRLEDILGYTPDLITVSFGGNDPVLVRTAPDKEFAPRRLVADRVLRVLFRYKAFLLARYLTSQMISAAENAEMPQRPRVSLEDYEANLEKMVALARGAGARVVLMTRPHDPTSRRAAPPGHWFPSIPLYNQVTTRVGHRLGAPVFDAYSLFEQAGLETFADGSHFTLLGHAEMARLLRDFFAVKGILP